jgi:hypothetical protein
MRTECGTANVGMIANVQPVPAAVANPHNIACKTRHASTPQDPQSQDLRQLLH